MTQQLYGCLCWQYHLAVQLPPTMPPVQTPPRPEGVAPFPPVAAYTPKGPDDTRGFTFGRGRGLPGPPSGPPSRTASGKLDPKAPAFVPSGLPGALSGTLSTADDGASGDANGGDNKERVRNDSDGAALVVGTPA